MVTGKLKHLSLILAHTSINENNVFRTQITQHTVYKVNNTEKLDLCDDLVLFNKLI